MKYLLLSKVFSIFIITQTFGQKTNMKEMKSMKQIKAKLINNQELTFWLINEKERLQYINNYQGLKSNPKGRSIAQYTISYPGMFLEEKSRNIYYLNDGKVIITYFPIQKQSILFSSVHDLSVFLEKIVLYKKNDHSTMTIHSRDKKEIQQVLALSKRLPDIKYYHYLYYQLPDGRYLEVSGTDDYARVYGDFEQLQSSMKIDNSKEGQTTHDIISKKAYSKKMYISSSKTITVLDIPYPSLNTFKATHNAIINQKFTSLLKPITIYNLDNEKILMVQEFRKEPSGLVMKVKDFEDGYLSDSAMQKRLRQVKQDHFSKYNDNFSLHYDKLIAKLSKELDIPLDMFDKSINSIDMINKKLASFLPNHDLEVALLPSLTIYLGEIMRVNLKGYFWGKEQVQIDTVSFIFIPILKNRKGKKVFFVKNILDRLESLDNKSPDFTSFIKHKLRLRK